MSFEDLLLQAQNGGMQATEMLLDMYQPFLLKEAIVDGVLDEDLLQELRIVAWKCIQNFRL